jgi:uncharacterized protein
MSVKKRVDEIDIIRGFALFGVLLINLIMINATLYSFEGIPFSSQSGMALTAAWAIRLLAQGKFYTIFSFLFGLGFYYFLGTSKSNEAYERFKKRLFVLLAIGIIHTIFIWHGDILHIYALAGFILLKNRNEKDSILLRKMILLFVFSTSIMVLGTYVSGSEITLNASQAFLVYQEGSYFEMVSYRIQNEIPIGIFNLIVVIPKVLVLFYAGYLVGRKEWFNQLDSQRERTRLYMKFSGILFATSMFMIWMASGFSHSIAVAGVILFEELSTLFGSVFYMTLILVIMQNNVLRPFLMPLRNLGRMALTNYLIQTIFWTTAYYGYGLGYFGKTPYYAYLPMALGFLAIQVVLSNFWLSRFKQGPVEKLWRLTYGDKS